MGEMKESLPSNPQRRTGDSKFFSKEGGGKKKGGKGLLGSRSTDRGTFLLGGVHHGRGGAVGGLARKRNGSLGVVKKCAVGKKKGKHNSLVQPETRP